MLYHTVKLTGKIFKYIIDNRFKKVMKNDFIYNELKIYFIYNS